MLEILARILNLMVLIILNPVYRICSISEPGDISLNVWKMGTDRYTNTPVQVHTCANATLVFTHAHTVVML